MNEHRSFQPVRSYLSVSRASVNTNRPRAVTHITPLNYSIEGLVWVRIKGNVCHAIFIQKHNILEYMWLRNNKRYTAAGISEDTAGDAER